MLENPRDVGVSTVREIAEAAKVKPNTVVRMARQVGFEGYDDFREPFRDAIRTGAADFPSRARWLQDIRKKGDLGGLYADMVQSAISNIEDTFAGIDAEQLKAAAEGEKLEWTTLYTNSSDVAKQEGFDEIADVFNHIAEVEQWHERRYNKLIEAVTNGTVFKAPSPALWKCRNCGRVHEGTEPPDICPSCLHPKAHFELYVENY